MQYKYLIQIIWNYPQSYVSTLETNIFYAMNTKTNIIFLYFLEIYSLYFKFESESSESNVLHQNVCTTSNIAIFSWYTLHKFEQ